MQAGEGFERMENEVLSPLMKHLKALGSKDVVLLAVPGNHDLKRPVSPRGNPPAAVRLLVRSEDFYEIEKKDHFWDDPASEYREVIQTAFANYQDWWRHTFFPKDNASILTDIREGELPGDFLATFTIPTSGNLRQELKIGVVGINTTFLQLTDGDYRRRLVCNLSQVSSACGGDLPAWIAWHDAAILLSHHGPEWLTEPCENNDYPAINPAGRFAVHLFGHTHENISRSMKGGGGPTLRRWQSASLFGMKTFGAPPTARKHGYASGRIQFGKNTASICNWPRLASFGSNGWICNSDISNGFLLEDSGNTPPESWDIHNPTNPSLSPPPPPIKRTKPHIPRTKADELGFVDLALFREEAEGSPYITWPHASKGLSMFLESVRDGGELFIIARSLETWLKDDFLKRLGERIIQDRLQCTIAIPHPEKRVRSLVANDPSQNFKDTMWKEIQNKLVAQIGMVDASQPANPVGGQLEIYGIPAYIPATFTLIAGREVEYCTLEVGIGVPPRKPRLYLYFAKKPERDLPPSKKLDAFRRLESIYRQILRERTPILRLPGPVTVIPESRAELESRYETDLEEILTDDPKEAINPDNLRQDPDVCDGLGKPLLGESVCIASLPLSNYKGGQHFTQTLSDLDELLKRRLPTGSPTFILLKDKSIFLPVFWYKRSFQDRFEMNEDRDKLVFEMMRSKIEAREAFTISLEQLFIDRNGLIYLQGFEVEREFSEKKVADSHLTQIRDTLDAICDERIARFSPRRPLDIRILIGSFASALTEGERKALYTFVQTEDNRKLPAPVKLVVDRLRVIVVDSILPKRPPQEEKGFDRIFLLEPGGWTRLVGDCANTLDGGETEYGVLSPNKWLAHEKVVEHLKTGEFYQVRPITAQVAPSLNCTNQCPICSYGKRKACLGVGAGAADVPSMSQADLYASLDALAAGGVRGVIFTGGGEPLTNPFTLAGMDRAKKLHHMGVGLFTNGQLLDQRFGETNTCARLAQIDPVFVRISLNAGNPTAYSLIHGASGATTTFDHVLQNIRLLAKAKAKGDGHSTASFKLDIGVLITPLILDNLCDLAFELKRIALDHPGMLNNVAFRPAVSYPGGGWNKEAATECVRYLRNSRNKLCQDLAGDFDGFVNDGKQFPRTLFDEARKIIENQVTPILMAGLDEGVRIRVSIPRQRFEDVCTDPAARKTHGCLASPLVVFIGPDTSVYHCVERALEPGLAYGKLNDVPGEHQGNPLHYILQAGRQEWLKKAGDFCGNCPPVCLLHENNAVFDEISQALASGPDERSNIQHEIDVAAEFFEHRLSKKLGEAVKFV